MKRWRPSLLIAGFGLLFLGSEGLPAEKGSADIQRTQAFLVMGYQGLLNELPSGKGPYLSTLLDLLEIPADQRAIVIGQIRAISKKTPNIMDFADHVLALGGLGVPAASPAAILSSPSVAPVVPTGPHVFTGDALENALKHLGKGMSVTVYPKVGEKVSGHVTDYDARTLWLRTPDSKSFKLDEILAVEAPDL